MFWCEQRKHPSALGKFEQIAGACKGKKVVMFLDYDGTLSPIVANPDAAYITDAVSPSIASPYKTNSFPWPPPTGWPPEYMFADAVFCVLYMMQQMRAAVRDVAKHFPTAIVSGRCRDKVHY